MLGKAGARRDVAGPLAGNAKLLLGGPGEKRDDKVLEGNHANAQLHQFGIGKGQQFVPSGYLCVPIHTQGATFVLPAGQRLWSRPRRTGDLAVCRHDNLLMRNATIP
jgi:hypothetical protein